jgi:hypothetical protein
MKKRAAIALLVAVMAFVYWRWKQATTEVVVDGNVESSIHGFLMPGQYVDVLLINTDPDGETSCRICCKALVKEMEILPENVAGTVRLTLEVPSDHASSIKASWRVGFLMRRPERSKLAEWLDGWLYGSEKQHTRSPFGEQQDEK